jgi:hypothetical protein
MDNLAELKAWISANFWKQEQVAGWVDRYFIRKGAQAFLNGLEVAGVLLVKTATSASVRLQSTGSGGRDWLWQTAATGSTAAGTTAGDVYLYDNTAGAYRVKVGSTGVMTVPGGIAFANETLANYDQGTWTPALSFPVIGDASLTYSAQVGAYTRIGNIVYYSATIVCNVFTIGTGSGNLRMSLPITVASDDIAPAMFSGLDLAAGTAGITFVSRTGQTYGEFLEQQDNAAVSIVQAAALASGDVIVVSGFYFV